MADLAATDIVYTENTNAWTRANPGYRRIWKLAFGDGVKTYPTGGIPITNAKMGCLNKLQALILADNGLGETGVQWVWDSITNSLRAFIGSAEVGAAATGVPNAPVLGAAGTYGVLAGSAVTNTGATVVNGDLGLSPGTSVTGSPPGVVTGQQNINNAAAAAAQSALTALYNDLASSGPATIISGDIGGTTKLPGVYQSTSTLGITGALTLDGGGDPNALFIFQVGSALTTATSSSVVLTNGTKAANVYWQIGSSATLGVTSIFAGTIAALTAITADTGAVISGRLLARNAAVTLDTNSITVPSSAVPPNQALTPVATVLIAESVGY